MSEEDKAKLKELWDFMSKMHDGSTRLISRGEPPAADEVIGAALDRFEQLFTKELNSD